RRVVAVWPDAVRTQPAELSALKRVSFQVHALTGSGVAHVTANDARPGYCAVLELCALCGELPGVAVYTEALLAALIVSDEIVLGGTHFDPTLSFSASLRS